MGCNHVVHVVHVAGAKLVTHNLKPASLQLLWLSLMEKTDAAWATPSWVYQSANPECTPMTPHIQKLS